MSGQTCSLCGMVVSNMNIHMKINHKKKKVKSSTCSSFGFTGIDSDKFTTTVIPEKDKSDIIPIISKSKLTENNPSKEFENRSQRIKRNVSMLSDVLEQETDKRLRGLGDTSECDVKESGSSDIFQPKLDMLGTENRRNLKELDSSRYKECPGCKTLFEGNRSGYRFVNREYFDHIGSCGLDVGLGYGVTMVVKETVKVKCEPEDIPIKHETSKKEIKTEDDNLETTLQAHKEGQNHVRRSAEVQRLWGEISLVEVPCQDTLDNHMIDKDHIKREGQLQEKRTKLGDVVEGDNVGFKTGPREMAILSTTEREELADLRKSVKYLRNKVKSLTEDKVRYYRSDFSTQEVKDLPEFKQLCHETPIGLREFEIPGIYCKEEEKVDGFEPSTSLGQLSRANIKQEQIYMQQPPGQEHAERGDSTVNGKSSTVKIETRSMNYRDEVGEYVERN